MCDVCSTFNRKVRSKKDQSKLRSPSTMLVSSLLIFFLPLVLVRLLWNLRSVKVICFCSGRRDHSKSRCKYVDLINLDERQTLFISYTGKVGEIFRRDVVEISPIIILVYAISFFLKTLKLEVIYPKCDFKVKLLKAFYGYLLDACRPKRVLFISSLFFAPLSSVCRRKGVKSWEIAHAFMHKRNPRYDFTDAKFHPCLADVLLLNKYSNFCHDFCGRGYAKVVGKNIFDQNLSPKLVDIEALAQFYKRIVVIGQDRLEDARLLKQIKFLSAANNELDFFFKPHPLGNYINHSLKKICNEEVLEMSSNDTLIMGSYSNYCIELSNLGYQVVVVTPLPIEVFEGTPIKYYANVDTLLI